MKTYQKDYRDEIGTDENPKGGKNKAALVSLAVLVTAVAVIVYFFRG